MIASERINNASEIVFNIIFSIEMVMKTIAWGFIGAGKHSYMKNSWNLLDFLVVVTGWVNVWVEAGNTSALKALRLLKPLKAINSVPGMQIQVKALFASIPSLLNVLALLTLMLFVFGILGMQLFGGKLRFKCVDSSTG